MLLRRVYNADCRGFVISLDDSDSMTLIIGSGSIRDHVISSVSLTIPTSDIGQNVSIGLYDDMESPIQVMIFDSGSDPVFPIKPAILMLANFFVRPNCSDLSTIDVFVYGFVDDKLYETPFEGTEVVWETV
jgi:hypothetical protein